VPCRDPAVFVTSLELTRLARGAAGPQWIGKAVKGHRRNGHVRAASKTVLERLQRRIASGEAETVPVSVNDDINEGSCRVPGCCQAEELLVLLTSF
jgi:hypothetical protein